METLQLCLTWNPRAEGKTRHVRLETRWGRGPGEHIGLILCSFQDVCVSPKHKTLVLTQRLYDLQVLGHGTNQVFVSPKGKRIIDSAWPRCPLAVQSTMTGFTLLPPPPPHISASGVLSNWCSYNRWIVVCSAWLNSLTAKLTVSRQSLPHPCFEKCFLNALPSAGSTCQVTRVPCRAKPSSTWGICNVDYLRCPYLRDFSSIPRASTNAQHLTGGFR